jgi:hypothetical protein
MEVHSTQKKYAEDNYPRMPQPNEDGIKEWSMVIYYLYIKINKIIIIILKISAYHIPSTFLQNKKVSPCQLHILHVTIYTGIFLMGSKSVFPEYFV